MNVRKSHFCERFFYLAMRFLEIPVLVKSKIPEASGQLLNSYIFLGFRICGQNSVNLVEQK
jgi:hypothetical protein